MSAAGIIVDVVIVLIIGISVLIGKKRGLVLSLISTLSIVIAMVASYFLMPPVSSLIVKAGLQEKAETAIGSVVEEGAKALGDKATVTCEQLMENSQIPEFMKKGISSIMSSEKKDGGVREMSDKIATKVAGASVKILAFLISFLVVSIALLIIKLLWKGVKELPVIHQIDSIGGVLFGLVAGILLINCLMLLFGALYSFGLVKDFTGIIRESLLGSLFYEHNLLGMIISSFVK